MNTKRCLLLIVAASACLAAGQSGEFWQKEYKQWSERECRKLLENSPWAQTYTLSQTLIEPVQRGSTVPGREQRPRIDYQVQFRSALPIRQALVRLQQISAQYERLAPEHQRSFDQQAQRLLSGRFLETVVVHVTFSSNSQSYDRELASYWQVQTVETLKNSVFVITHQGDKVPLSRYAVSGGGREFQLVFPREYKGAPLVGPEDKAFRLEFTHPRIGVPSETRVLLEFKVEKMVIQGTVVY
ncbi:MAG TPA: hypothetical protein VGJ66_12205 [Pyrinomonadaceae bacterium]